MFGKYMNGILRDRVHIKELCGMAPSVQPEYLNSQVLTPMFDGKRCQIKEVILSEGEDDYYDNSL